jgi:nucleotide-binding universal stress UspA family protein
MTPIRRLVMNVRPSILCPVDFSVASAGALRYAAAIAEHFATRLIVLTVEEPLLTDAVRFGTGIMWRPEGRKEELEQFATRIFGREASTLAALEFEVAVGGPAAEILRVARERSCDLIVLSSQGSTGHRTLFFGSTTERVLRETTRPALVTPPHDPGPIGMDDASRLIRRVLVPVDLSPASLHQTQSARAAAGALGLSMLLVHILEPLRSRLAAKRQLASLDADRRAIAEDGLHELMATIPLRLHPEALVEVGDPAEELAKVARDRQVGLVVIGLHNSPFLGPHIGSVTYRLLCLTPAMVLAIPPKNVEAWNTGQRARTAVAS